MNAPRTRRRWALLALVVAVSLVHWGLGEWLPLPRIGDAAADRMPQRIAIAFVRELAPAAPPQAPRVVAKAPTTRAAARPKAAAEAASAPRADDAAAQAQSESAPEPASAASPASAPAEAVAAVASAASSTAPAASAAASTTAFEWPPSTRLSYKLRGNYRGEVVGAAQVEWVHVGTRYQVHLDVWIGAQAAPLVGRRMTSDGEVGAMGLSPKRYDEQTRALFGELRRRSIVFDDEHVLLANGKQFPHVDGMQDSASHFVQLTWLFTTQPQLLRIGQRIEIPLALPTNVDRWSYEVIEQTTLDTPFGPLATFHVKPRRELRPNRELVADAWFAPTLQYLPVRLLIRQDESTYIDLTLDRLPQQAARPDAPSASPPSVADDSAR